MTEEITIIKGGGYNLLGRVAKLVLGFLLTVYLARFMGPHNFGLLRIGLVMVTIFFVFSDLGLSQSMLFYIPKFMGQDERGKAGSIYELTRKVMFALGAAMSAILFLLSDIIAINLYHVPGLGLLLRIFSAALLFQTMFIFYKLTFQAFRNMKYYMMVDVVLGAFKFIALIMVLLGFGTFGAFVGITVAHFLVFLFTYLVVGIGSVDIPGERSPIKSKPLFKLAVYFLTLNILGILFGSITDLIIGFLLDPSSVSFFSLSLSISSILLILPQSLGDSLQPFVSENVGDSSRAHDAINRIMKYSFIVTIPAAGGIILLRESILRFIYGSAYTAASGVMVPVVMGGAVMGCLWTFVPMVYGTGKVRIELESDIIQAALNLSMCLVLIPAFGIVGAGIAYLFMNLGGFIYTGAKVRKRIEFKMPWNSIFKSIISTGLMLLVIERMQWVFGSWLKLFVIISVGAGLYISLMYVMGEFDETDKRFVKGILRRMGLI